VNLLSLHVRGHAAFVSRFEHGCPGEEKTGGKTKSFGEEKVKIKHNLTAIIHRQKMKAEEDKLKMKKIKNMLVTRKIASIILWMLL
jgi:hypothetical protein